MYDSNVLVYIGALVNCDIVIVILLIKLILKGNVKINTNHSIFIMCNRIYQLGPEAKWSLILSEATWEIQAAYNAGIQ